jgi:hypothetical protein
MDRSAGGAPSVPEPARKKSRRGLWLVVAGVLVLVVVGGLGGVLAGRIWQRLHASGDTTEFRSTGSVVVAVRDLARLEGAEYQVERVVSATDKQSRLWGLFEAQDAILLVASGNIVAGVDLSLLGDGDFDIDETKRSVAISLPSSTVFTARLDNDRTFIYRRDTDLLALRHESLETRARQDAEKALLEAATQEGIIRRSNESVRRTVESLARSLGYRQVTVTFRDSTEQNPH